MRKRDGSRQRFERAKLRSALLRAAHKRPVSAGDIEALVDRAQAELAAAGELAAEELAELCLAGLRELDAGAYLQFAGTLPSPQPQIPPSAPAGSVRAARQPRSFQSETGE